MRQECCFDDTYSEGDVSAQEGGYINYLIAVIKGSLLRGSLCQMMLPWWYIFRGRHVGNESQLWFSFLLIMIYYSCEINKIVRTANDNSFTYEVNHSEHHVESPWCHYVERLCNGSSMSCWEIPGQHHIERVHDLSWLWFLQACHVKKFHDNIMLTKSVCKLAVILARLSCWKSTWQHLVEKVCDVSWLWSLQTFHVEWFHELCWDNMSSMRIYVIRIYH